jgi:hypothetical protein
MMIFTRIKIHNFNIISGLSALIIEAYRYIPNDIGGDVINLISMRGV